MPLLIVPVLLVLLVIVVIPISIVQRFRVAASERRARAWLATLNLVGIAVSAVLFIAGALVTSYWVPDVLSYTLGGLAMGAGLGVVGVALTRWRHVDGYLRYAPNRFLALGLTTIVAARVLYGFWRTWETWRSGIDGVAPGIATSMSAGSVVLGYYLVFWTGVRWRIGRMS
jgi:hypothetical protein